MTVYMGIYGDMIGGVSGWVIGGCSSSKYYIVVVGVY